MQQMQMQMMNACISDEGVEGDIPEGATFSTGTISVTATCTVCFQLDEAPAAAAAAVAASSVTSPTVNQPHGSGPAAAAAADASA